MSGDQRENIARKICSLVDVVNGGARKSGKVGKPRTRKRPVTSASCFMLVGETEKCAKFPSPTSVQVIERSLFGDVGSAG